MHLLLCGLAFSMRLSRSYHFWSGMPQILVGIAEHALLEAVAEEIRQRLLDVLAPRIHVTMLLLLAIRSYRSYVSAIF